MLGILYFFLFFAVAHVYWLGELFESILSILVTIYLALCTWAFSYIFNSLDWLDEFIKRNGTFYQALWVVLYLVAPFIYVYLRFYKTKNVQKVGETERDNENKKFKFSRTGFFTGCFYFFLIIVYLHAAWLGNLFESLLSIIVFVYLSICIWALSYIQKELEPIIDTFLEKPLGQFQLLFVRFVLYLIAPAIFIRLKFFDRE
jgi:hypothetical protein